MNRVGYLVRCLDSICYFEVEDTVNLYFYVVLCDGSLRLDLQDLLLHCVVVGYYIDERDLELETRGKGFREAAEALENGDVLLSDEDEG